MIEGTRISLMKKASTITATAIPSPIICINSTLDDKKPITTTNSAPAAAVMIGPVLTIPSRTASVLSPVRS